MKVSAAQDPTIGRSVHHFGSSRWLKMAWTPLVVLCFSSGLVASPFVTVDAFSPAITVQRNKAMRTMARFSPLASSASMEEGSSAEEDTERQWDLFQRHHAIGSWKGIWTSYDYLGDVVDTTVASVDYANKEGTVSQVHTIAVGATASDCETCFDSTETKSFPVASYQKGQLRKNRLGSVGMVTGPSLLRSGAMATELVLASDSTKERVRVILQHAPVWEAGVEPNSCPPQGLKLFRTTVCREYLDTSPPEFPPGVPPFAWFQKWGGTSWTWGPSSGDRGWNVEELEEADAWHFRPTGDTMNVWSMRLPGGILLQAPRVVSTGEIGIYRFAWMPQPKDASNKGSVPKLLRIEAGIKALEPIPDDSDDTMMVGFYPPSLASLRCDTFEKVGELENTSILGIDVNAEDDEIIKPKNENDPPSSEGLDAVRNALRP